MIITSPESSKPGNTPLQDVMQVCKSLQFPITPGSTIKLFKDYMTEFEISEILSYKKIYYIGLLAKKINAKPLGTENSDFDDEKGYYIPISRDHLAYRYEMLELLG